MYTIISVKKKKKIFSAMGGSSEVLTSEGPVFCHFTNNIPANKRWNVKK